MREDLDGAAHVVVHQLELAAHVLGELADIEVLVDEQDADHGGREEVGEVVGRHGELVDLLLVLRVNGVELLVHRLKLLVGALQLLVGREELLVGGLQLLVHGLELADRGLEVALGVAQLRLEVGDAPRGRRIDVVLLDRTVRLAVAPFDEEHGREARLEVARHGDGLQHEVDDAAAARAVHADVLVGDGLALRAAARERRGRREREVGVDDREEVERRLARSDAHVVQVVSKEVDDVVGLVDDHCRGEEAFEEVRVDALEAVVRGAMRLGGHVLGRDGLHRGDVEVDGLGPVHLAGAVVHVDLLGGEGRLEDVGILVGRLALAEEEIAAVLEGGVEDGKEAALQHRLEVDHDVAAADEVELAEGRVGEHVVRRKDHHLPDVLGDVIGVVALHEEPCQPVGRHVLDDALGEDALARLLDGLDVDVRRKDLDVAMHLELVEDLLEQDGQRIGLLARGASRAPHADGVAVGAPADDVGDDLVLEHLEERGVAEEARHADENLLGEHGDLVGALVQDLRVLGERPGVGDHEAPLDAADDGRALVVREVDPVLLLEREVDAREALLVAEELQPLLGDDVKMVAGEVHDLPADLARGKHPVHEAGADRAAGHPVELGALGLLHDGEAAPVLDRPDAAGAVGSRAGEDHGHRALAVLLGQRVEEDVDGVVEDGVVVVREAQAPVADREVLLGRDEVDRVGLDLGVPLHLEDLHLGLLAEDVRHEAAMVGREVLDHHEAEPAVGGKRLEQLLQRLDAARRRPDSDHKLRGALRGPPRLLMRHVTRSLPNTNAVLKGANGPFITISECRTAGHRMYRPIGEKSQGTWPRRRTIGSRRPPARPSRGRFRYHGGDGAASGGAGVSMGEKIRDYIQSEWVRRRAYLTSARDEIRQENLDVACNACLLTIFILIGCLLISPLIIRSWALSPPHLLFAPAMLFLFVVIRLYRTKSSTRSLATFLSVLVGVTIISFGIAIDTMTNPMAPTVFTPLMIVALSALFIMPAMLNCAISGALSIAYAACSLAFKDPYVAQFDILSAIAALVFSVCVTHIVMQYRLVLFEAKMHFQELSMRDDLSKVFNKRALLSLTRDYFENAEGHAPCTLIFIDLDDLKSINDVHGHMVGDSALRIVSEILRSNFRSTDIVGRFGGDEFIVFIPGPVSEAALKSKMGRIQAELTAKSQEKLGFPTTISAGAVITRQGLPEVTELIKMADAALYQSKHGGKNRITIHLLDFKAASK